MSEAGQVGVLVHISAAIGTHRYERGNRYRPRIAVVFVPTACMKRERVTETTVKTVVCRTVADVAVDQDTVGIVANKVSLVSDMMCGYRGVPK